MLTSTQISHLRRQDLIPFARAFEGFLAAPAGRMHDALLEVVAEYDQMAARAIAASKKPPRNAAAS